MTSLLLAIVLLLSGCAGGNWTRGDSIRQGAFTALAAADWAQSRQIATENWVVDGKECPDYPRWHESNPILGEHPSKGQVNAYFITAILGHAAISRALPPKWRAAWQYLSIGVEGGYVIHNYQMGVRVNW